MHERLRGYDNYAVILQIGVRMRRWSVLWPSLSPSCTRKKKKTALFFRRLFFLRVQEGGSGAKSTVVHTALYMFCQVAETMSMATIGKLRNLKEARILQKLSKIFSRGVHIILKRLDGGTRIHLL